jgi:hypothetical protein
MHPPRPSQQVPSSLGQDRVGDWTGWAFQARDRGPHRGHIRATNDRIAWTTSVTTGPGSSQLTRQTAMEPQVARTAWRSLTRSGCLTLRSCHRLRGFPRLKWPGDQAPDSLAGSPSKAAVAEAYSVGVLLVVDGQELVQELLALDQVGGLVGVGCPATASASGGTVRLCWVSGSAVDALAQRIYLILYRWILGDFRGFSHMLAFSIRHAGGGGSS